MATTISPKRKARKKSVLKRIRQTEHRTRVNRAKKTRLRAQVKKFRQALASGNLTQAREWLQATISVIDRSSRKGIIHPNTAARSKSRLLLRYNTLANQARASA